MGRFSCGSGHTTFSSAYVKPHIAEIFPHVPCSWEAASPTSASTSKGPLTSIWTPKNKIKIRDLGEKGLGTALKIIIIIKKIMSLCFNILVCLEGTDQLCRQYSGRGDSQGSPLVEAEVSHGPSTLHLYSSPDRPRLLGFMAAKEPCSSWRRL